MIDLAPVRLGVAISMLGGAAVLDLRTRRVPNRYWFPFVAIAGALLLAEFAWTLPVDRRETIVYDAMAIGLVAFFYLVWRLRLFGGADAKALMVLAVLEPRPVVGGLPVPPALGTLALASIAGALVPVVFLLWNAGHGRFRLPAAFLAVPMELGRARNAKVWPIQEVDAAGRVRFRYWVKLGGGLDERMAARYAALEQAGVTTVWVTPKLPFFVPLLVGALTWVWVGTLPLPQR
ncbi:MAG: prepilin peptidase [bacterium]